jgi:hypothetical protein
MSTNETEEKAYIAESLNFINSVDLTYSYKYKDYFTPVLTNIVNDLIAEEALIDDMNKMITRKRDDKSNSNLKELIVKLIETKKIGPNKYMQISHNGDNAKYVEQCLKIIGITGSKKIIYELFYLVMQDLEKLENADLMEKVNSFKKDNQDWKKMVGMLIPPGAQVNILTDIIEPINKFALGKDRNKATVLTSRELIGTVVKRGKLDGALRGGNFQKVVRLPKEIIRKDNLAYKNEELMVNPENIELHVPNAEAGEGEGEGEAATAGEGTEEAPRREEASAATAGEGTEEAPRREEASATTAVVVATAATAASVPVVAATEGASGPESGATAGGELRIPVEKPEQSPAVESEIGTKDVQLIVEGVEGVEGIKGAKGAKGGQQRTTRKHKNAIIGSAKKSRTYR